MTTSRRRVSWAHDSDSLEKPKPTKIATYIIGDSDLICKVEIVPAHVNVPHTSEDGGAGTHQGRPDDHCYQGNKDVSTRRNPRALA